MGAMGGKRKVQPTVRKVEYTGVVRGEGGCNIEQGRIQWGDLTKDLKEIKELAMWVSGETAFQAKGTTRMLASRLCWQSVGSERGVKDDLNVFDLSSVRIEMRSTGWRRGFKVGSGNQELGLDIIFKYFVRSSRGGQVSSSICKAGVHSWRSKVRRHQPRGRT